MRNPLTFFGKRARASRANEHARELDAEGKTEEAIAEYERARDLDPKWAVPVYNLGLVYKYRSEWQLSLDHNQLASQLDPSDQAGWWNLGIAATALGRWDVARAAWRGAGIAIPEGEGPIDFACGTTPIRLNPETEAEVVWAHRLDPARAVLRSIPLPESGFRYGDIVLNDGAATGYRKLEGREVSVFNCLALLTRSQFSTWVLEVEIDPESDSGTMERLLELATECDLAAEDWSTSLRMMCKACSEGHPHDDHEHEPEDPGLRHRIAIAAPDSERARRLVDDWKAGATGVTIVTFESASGFAH